MIYLLDTNICIHYLNGQFAIAEKLKKIGFHNVAISEITLAELIFGAEKSQKTAKNRQAISDFIEKNNIKVLPISNAIEFYATEKARLQANGRSVDDFDLLIGATSVQNNLIMVTRNIRHFEHISNIRLENWIDN